ncbi:MAG: hypothetical protein JSV66_03985 [Trueperaceae bacterium]|nr:MAG: hypothetical protein JSV66_03985 [Trueperaceae bacterium]
MPAGNVGNDHPLEVVLGKLEAIEAELLEVRRENTALRQRFEALPPPRDEAVDLRWRLDYTLGELERRDAPPKPSPSQKAEENIAIEGAFSRAYRLVGHVQSD